MSFADTLQGRAGLTRAGHDLESVDGVWIGDTLQGRAGLSRAGHDLESVDGVWIADIVLQQTGLVSWDASRVSHKLYATSTG